MRDLSTYLDLAKLRQGLVSDNQLAIAWHVRRQSVHDYRNGIAMPRADKLLQLAEMAGIPTKEAYIEWTIWQAEHARQDRAAETARELLRIVQSAPAKARLGGTGGLCKAGNA